MELFPVDPVGNGAAAGDHRWDQAVLLQRTEVLRSDQVEADHTQPRGLAAHAGQVQPCFGETPARNALLQPAFACHSLGLARGGSGGRSRGGCHKASSGHSAQYSTGAAASNFFRSFNRSLMRVAQWWRRISTYWGVSGAAASAPSPAYDSFTLITLFPLNVTKVIRPGGLPYIQSSSSSPSLVSRDLFTGRHMARRTCSFSIPSLARFSLLPC